MTAAAAQAREIAEGLISGAPLSATARDVLILGVLNALLAAEARGREAGLEEAAVLIEGNHLLRGSIGPLMNIGWAKANECGAAAIRALASKEPP